MWVGQRVAYNPSLHVGHGKIRAQSPRPTLICGDDSREGDRQRFSRRRGPSVPGLSPQNNLHFNARAAYNGPPFFDMSADMKLFDLLTKPLAEVQAEIARNFKQSLIGGIKGEPARKPEPEKK